MHHYIVRIMDLLMQPDGGIINEAAAARTSMLERELHQRMSELEETSQQAQALASENASLRGELGRLQDRMHVVEQDSSATQVNEMAMDKPFGALYARHNSMSVQSFCLPAMYAHYACAAACLWIQCFGRCCMTALGSPLVAAAGVVGSDVPVLCAGTAADAAAAVLEEQQDIAGATRGAGHSGA